MDNFKSFNEFLKEQHGGAPEIQAAPKEPPSQQPSPEEPPKEPVKKKKHKKESSHTGSSVKNYVFGGVVVVLAGILALFLLPIPLGYISLTGTDVLTVDDILFEGKIRQPVNVPQVSTTDLTRRLSKDIRVSSVTVTRKFPFVLSVDITDRRPVAIVQDQFGYAFVDADGMVMDTTQSIKKVEVPLITGKKMGNLLLGDRISGDDVAKALDFLNNLSPDGLKVFSEINIGNADSIKAYTRDGITVRLGEGDNMADRAKLAENMVGDVKARKLSVEYVDANLASPFIKLKK